MLLHLDFSLNYSDYILSTIKIHQVRADYKFMLKRAQLDVRQCGEGAASQGKGPQSIFTPFLLRQQAFG